MDLDLRAVADVLDDGVDGDDDCGTDDDQHCSHYLNYKNSIKNKPH